MKHIKLLFLLLFVSGLGYGQIITIDFETLGSGYTPSGTEGAGFTDVFNRTNPNIGGNGTYMWSVEDLNLVNPSIDIDQIDVTSATDFTFSLDMLAHHYNDWDSTDELLITYSIDGGTYQNLMWVQNAGATFNEAASLDTDFDGDGNCGAGILPAITTGNSGCNVTNNTFQNFSTSAIALSGNTTLDIRLQFNGLTSADEGIYLDNIVIDVTGGSTNTTVDFVSTTSTLAEDGAFIDVCVAITNEDATNATTVEIALDGASTATNGTDYDDGAGTPAAITFPQTLTFPAGSSTNECLTIYISNDDAVFESSEDVILNLQNAAGGNAAALGTNTQHTLTITDNDFTSTVMITQYYEGSSTNKWVEVKNISGAVIPANTFYIVMLNNADADNPAAADPTVPGSPSFGNNVLISTDMAVDEVRRFREPSAVLPAYACPGEVGYDGNPTFDLPNGPFSGDDIVLISTTNDSTTWANRVDVIGDGTTWGNRLCFIRNECIANGPSITFDINNWLIFTDAEVETPVLDTNPYLGQHFQGATTFDATLTWDNGVPDRSRLLVLDEDYDTSAYGNLEGCSLIINATNTLNIITGNYVEIQNDITNSGQISISDSGSLVQVNNNAVFTDSSTETVPVSVARRTAPVAAWYEYTYWSSPVPEATLENLLPNTSAARKFSFNASNFYDNQAEIFNTGTFTANTRDDIDDDANDWEYASGVMTPASGYAATLGPDDLLGPGAGSTGVIKNFEGNTLNTGTITVPVNRNDLSILDNNWNLIGNPYPSAIDINLFLDENRFGFSPNGVLDGAIYFWSQATPPNATTSGNENLNFDVSDYAIRNISSAVAGEQYTPTDYIASGQGFFVSYSESASTTSDVVTFNNSMRVIDNNTEFYRINNTVGDNKLWLNLTSDNGVYSQLSIAYVNGATNDDDGPSYDARRFYSGASAMLVSFANNSTTPLAIQGRQPEILDLDEVIPLGFITGITSPTIYTISIDHLQGDFITNNTVYLKDNLLTTIHDLSASDYSFTSNMGEFNNRFEVVFNNASLFTNDFVLNENNFSIIELENNNVLFKTGNELTIKSVQIFDVLGRNLYTFKGNSNAETYNVANLSQTAYVAQIELSNGQTISKKAIKK